MKTHRMYRQQREEVPNILVLKPGVNRVPIEVLIRQSWFRDSLRPPEQVMGVHTMNPMYKCELEP